LYGFADGQRKSLKLHSFKYDIHDTKMARLAEN
jgi:hypothetical protein